MQFMVNIFLLHFIYDLYFIQIFTLYLRFDEMQLSYYYQWQYILIWENSAELSLAFCLSF